jgi:acetyl-CoA synthetase (ADP-forming)
VTSPRSTPLSNLFREARAAGRSALDEPAAKRVLAAHGLAVPAGARVSPGESSLPGTLKPPFAVKLISRDASHKSDVGGVRLGLADARAALAAARDMEALARSKGLALDGVLVEEMSPPGVELVVGGLVDARFGPVLMLGLGGVFVEIFGDTAFRVCPIDTVDARQMIDELKGAPLLRGARGRKPVDEERVVDALLKVSSLLVEWEGEVAELDINPLIVSESSAIACDARIVLADK